MKQILFISLFITFSVFSLAQHEKLLELLYYDKDINCEELTLEIMDKIYEIYLQNSNENIDSLVKILDFFCGKNESIQRVIIFTSIPENNIDKNDIETYMKKHFPAVLTYRKRDSNSSDYQNFYDENKDYYGYLPLRHPIDSVISAKSKEYLRNNSVFDDSKLFCILFANDSYAFNKELSKKIYKTSVSRKIRNEIKYQNSRNDPSIVVCFGVHSMIGYKNIIFKSNPYVCFSISTPLRHKIVCDVGVKMRINVNDKDFLFKVNGETELVNSGTTQLFDLNVGYKILDNKRFIFIPHIGAGFESTGTGKKDKIQTDEGETYKYYSLHALNLSFGVTVYTPVFVKNYIGFSINYHYCPYQWNNKLDTKFNNNSLSCGLIYRF